MTWTPTIPLGSLAILTWPLGAEMLHLDHDQFTLDSEDDEDDNVKDKGKVLVEKNLAAYKILVLLCTQSSQKLNPQEIVRF
ncbi:hypothetical protein L1887_06192 [Cichorium endivia]|nr:hypothetical protein L1887_06192 [Cichorium endivia]